MSKIGMKRAELISVIVPVYNISLYIEKCVKTIIEQTYSDLEIILVDDGSTDGSGEILDRLADEDNRIRVIHQANSGVTSARLAGVRVSKGDWIGFVDGDDEIEQEMFERLLINAHKYGADISHCGYQKVFPDRIEYYYNTGRLIVQNRHQGVMDLVSGTFVEPGLWNKLFNKGLFYDVLNNDRMDKSIRYYEDLLMNFYLFNEISTSVYEDFCPYHYHARDGSASTSQINEHKLEDPLRVLKIIKNETKGDTILQKTVNRRISGLLIRLATMNTTGNEELSRPHRDRARKDLGNLLPELIEYKCPVRSILLSAWAVLSPSSYSTIHTAYSILKVHIRSIK